MQSVSIYKRSSVLEKRYQQTTTLLRWWLVGLGLIVVAALAQNW